jgi:hypothetical protein
LFRMRRAAGKQQQNAETGRSQRHRLGIRTVGRCCVIVQISPPDASDD